jgi:triacylglycerol lipase
VPSPGAPRTPFALPHRLCFLAEMRKLLRLLILAITAAGAAAAEPAQECVVLLHGVGLSGWVMNRVEGALEDEGYRVINVSYPSRKMPIEQIASEFLPAELKRADVASAPKLHFVTHSMGSLVVRLYLRDNQPANLGRVVMLGPPNHGSVAADRAADNSFMRYITGVNVEKLGTRAGGIAATLPPPNFEVGVIAGSTTINPIFLNVLKGQPHDGAVTVKSARLEGMKDFIAMPHSHTVMLWRRPVIDQVIAFLKNGKFVR